MNGPASPLYQAIIDTRLAPEFADQSGMDASTILPTFSIGVKGIPDDQVEKVSKSIQDTLEATKGFDPERVEALIHQLELSLLHNKVGILLGVFVSTLPFSPTLVYISTCPSSYPHTPYWHRSNRKYFPLVQPDSYTSSHPCP